MLNHSNYRMNVLDAYHEIQTHLSALHQAMQSDQHLGSWIQDLTDSPYFLLDNPNARERAFNTLSQLEYLPLQAPREIIICAGFVGASSKTLDIIEALNKAKEDFKAAILQLKSQKISLHDDFFTTHFGAAHRERERDQETAKLLNKSGLARLHLKQCYRKVPILPHAPLKISWTWAHTRSIKKISVAQAYEKLCQKGAGIGIQLQIKKLSSLSGQAPLAIVQELAPHLRANIVLDNPKGEKLRRMIKGPVPIFYPAQPDTPLPQFKPPVEKCDKNKDRLIRSDVQLDPIPFLPAIRVHRYID